MKSPKPNQNKPHHTTKRGLAIQKLQKQTQQKGPSNIAAPPTRRKDNNKNPISHATNQTNNTPSMVQASSDQHTPQNDANTVTQTNQTKSLAHYRVLTQHTHTQTHPTTKEACSKRLDRPYTHPHNKQNRLPCESNERIYQRLFSYRHLTRITIRRGVVGHADSHKATHTQPTTQTSRLITVFRLHYSCVLG